MGFDLNNTIRYNKVTNVLGSSSSNGKYVCQGQAADRTLGCRGVAWSIYLDGAYSGAQIHSNILDGSSKGALIINGGSKVHFVRSHPRAPCLLVHGVAVSCTHSRGVCLCGQVNNIVLGAKSSNVMLNFCYQQRNALHVTTWPPNSFARNIFSWNSTRADSSVYGTPGPPNGPPCVWVPMRLSGSDYNLYWNTAIAPGLAHAALFPGNQTLRQWQHGNATTHDEGQPPPPPTQGAHPPFAFPPFDLHSTIADPEFGEQGGYDGRLKPSSPAFKLGFVPLPDIEHAAPRLQQEIA